MQGFLIIAIIFVVAALAFIVAVTLFANGIPDTHSTTAEEGKAQAVSPAQEAGNTASS